MLLRIEEGCSYTFVEDADITQTWEKCGSTARHSYPTSGYISKEKLPQHIKENPVSMPAAEYTQYLDCRITLGA